MAGWMVARAGHRRDAEDRCLGAAGHGSSKSRDRAAKLVSQSDPANRARGDRFDERFRDSVDTTRSAHDREDDQHIDAVRRGDTDRRVTV